jgi:hypothetical protein
MHGTQSSANRALMLNTLHDPRFEVDDLDGVNFQEIEEQLREDVQSPWGGNGWCRTTIIIVVPIGLKSTAASHHVEANTCTQARQNDKVDPNTDPYPRLWIKTNMQGLDCDNPRHGGLSMPTVHHQER